MIRAVPLLLAAAAAASPPGCVAPRARVVATVKEGTHPTQVLLVCQVRGLSGVLSYTWRLGGSLRIVNPTTPKGEAALLVQLGDPLVPAQAYAECAASDEAGTIVGASSSLAPLVIQRAALETVAAAPPANAPARALAGAALKAPPLANAPAPVPTAPPAKRPAPANLVAPVKTPPPATAIAPTPAAVAPAPAPAPSPSPSSDRFTVITVDGSGFGPMLPAGSEDGVYLVPAHGAAVRADHACKAAQWSDARIVCCRPASLDAGHAGAAADAGPYEVRVQAGGRLAVAPGTPLGLAGK